VQLIAFGILMESKVDMVAKLKGYKFRGNVYLNGGRTRTVAVIDGYLELNRYYNTLMVERYVFYGLIPVLKVTDGFYCKYSSRACLVFDK